MKFLHGADLHLDRSFEGLTNVKNAFQPYLMAANQKMLENIVDLAIAEDVDFVLLVGDTFHQHRPTLKTQQHFFAQMNRLAEKNIPVVMNFGNHDYYQSQRYWFDFPENMQLFTDETVATKKLQLKDGQEIAISSFSFAGPIIETEKNDQFPRKVGDFHIGMYHGGQFPYAPFTTTKLAEKGYDYWALGHIHVPQMVSERPPAYYSGTPLGHTKKEKNLAGVLLVEELAGKMKLQKVPVAPVVWQEMTISLNEIRRSNQLLPFLVSQLTLAQPTLVQLKLTDNPILAEEIQYQLASGELLDTLNTALPAEIFVTEIVFTSTTTERHYLAVDENLVDQLLTTYQSEEVFSAQLAEINPKLQSLLTSDFQTEVLQTVQEKIKQDYRFRREKDVD